MESDWKKVKVPLGLTVGVASALVYGYFYLHSSFVMAADFRQYQENQSKELRSIQRQNQILYLERDLKKMETDKLILDVKRNTAPQSYTPVDKALHEKLNVDVDELKQEIKQLKVEEQRLR